ncbi:MAG: NAD-dependent epimerase/dehydratase family protein [Thermomicrobiales bacterium]
MPSPRNDAPLHVVLGTGPAGITLANLLADRGHRVRSVDRRGNGPARPEVERVKADLSHPEAAIAATRGAAVIYHAVNVAYPLQTTLLPGITDAILAAAEANTARLVVLDTLYPYGTADGEAITEHSPWAATSRKGLLRVELDWRYLEAHRAGRVRTVMGRSADFFGPGVVNSTLGGAFFPQALTGQPAFAFGDITLPHSYSYLPDIAHGLALLGESDRGDGLIWHLPTVPAVPTAEIHAIVASLLGTPVPVEVVPEPRPVGPFDQQFIDEYAEMFYQHRIPQNMVSAAFEDAFGARPTPLRTALADTIAWYRTFLAGWERAA